MVKPLRFCVGVALIPTLFATIGFAWGDRGHHLIGVTAARRFAQKERLTGNTGAGTFIESRSMQLGYLSNVPDTSWRGNGSNQPPMIRAIGTPLHFINVEQFLGMADSTPAAYVQHIRQLPADYTLLKKRYDGKPGAVKPGQNLRTFEDGGTAPWYAQQLFDHMVEAFQCAHAKPWQDRITEVRVFQELPRNIRSADDLPLPTYRCMANTGRNEDLYAATVLAGILSHIVGDLTQPLHVSVDYDGWMEGQGGIHSYFETDILQALDEGLVTRISAQADRHSADILASIPLSAAEILKPWGVARALLAVSADSWGNLAEVLRIDREVALYRDDNRNWQGSLGSFLTPSDNPHSFSHHQLKPARRVGAHNRAVLAAFGPLVEERLALATVVLSQLWLLAYHAGGSPLLKGLNTRAMPYPSQVPP
jgi:hypothetical protein